MSMPDLTTPIVLNSENTILLIDDDPDIVWTTTRMLEEAGYTVLSGFTAAEALALTQRHRPPIVLLDVELPDGNGVDVARQIKLDPELAGVFVVMVSGSRISPQDQADGLRKGLADGYVLRPFSKVDFMARIEAFLRIRLAQEELKKAKDTAEYASRLKSELLLELEMQNAELSQAREEVERLNSDLAARAAELESANIELETFNYTVSHDLRRPLTAINSYCQLVQELYCSGFDEECRGYIREIYKSTLNMNQLIEALLSFSHMVHIELSREMIDLGAVAHEIVMTLKLTEPDRRADVRIANGIVVNADANLMRIVLDNLLGNAWKYTGIRKDAVIEFGVTDIDGVPVYFVRDNGAGIDKADVDKLFIPFKRLSVADEFKGFGIGLATVERIIRRHGGKVWAEGEPGKGATFYFTLSAD